MADAKKIELDEKNLSEVAGGDFLPDGSYMPNFYGDADKIAEQMQKQYADTKKIEGEGDFGDGNDNIKNSNANGKQNIVNIGRNNSANGNIKF